MIPLPLHLFIHFFLAILSGYFAGKYFKNMPLAIFIGFCGGFLIDLDHVLEYFLVYGPHFNFLYLTQGRQFLISDQTRLWFHAWDYLPILLIIGYLLRKNKTLKIICFTLALAGSVHLITDCFINQVSPQFYSLSYRAYYNFSSQDLISPENYQKNQELKSELGL